MFDWITSLFRKREPLRLRDGHLGDLTGEKYGRSDVMWEARVVVDERRVPLWLGGDENGVNADERAVANCVIERLPDFIDAAREFLSRHREFEGEPPLVLYAVSIEKDGFVIEFQDRSEDGVWRAEFEGNRPVRLGFDD